MIGPSARWAYSPVDCRAHLLMGKGGPPRGQHQAHCGAVLAPTTFRTSVRPAAALICPACEEVVDACPRPGRR